MMENKRAILEQKALEQAEKEIADELHYCELRYLWANGRSMPSEDLQKLKDHFNANLSNRVKHLVGLWSKND